MTTRAQNYAILQAEADRAGASPEMVSFLRTIMHHESGANARARNPNSTATGLFQFIRSTWEQYGQGRDIYDPRAQCAAVIEFAGDNAEALRAAFGPEFEMTAGRYYLAHFAGSGGAIAAIQNPNTLIRDIEGLGQRAINANRGIHLNVRNADGSFTRKPFAQFTGADLQAWADGIMSGAAYFEARDREDRDEADLQARRFLQTTGFTQEEIDRIPGGTFGDLITAIITAIIQTMFPEQESEMPQLLEASNDNLPVQALPVRAPGVTALQA